MNVALLLKLMVEVVGVKPDSTGLTRAHKAQPREALLQA